MCWAFKSFNIDGNNEIFFLFELKLYLALGLFSKLFENTSEEHYNSRREVFVVVVEGLGPQCSDPLCFQIC